MSRLDNDSCSDGKKSYFEFHTTRTNKSASLSTQSVLTFLWKRITRNVWTSSTAAMSWTSCTDLILQRLGEQTGSNPSKYDDISTPQAECKSSSGFIQGEVHYTTKYLKGPQNGKINWPDFAEMRV